MTVGLWQVLVYVKYPTLNDNRVIKRQGVRRTRLFHQTLVPLVPLPRATDHQIKIFRSCFCSPSCINCFASITMTSIILSNDAIEIYKRLKCRSFLLYELICKSQVAILIGKIISFKKEIMQNVIHFQVQIAYILISTQVSVKIIEEADVCSL